jgi:hypothetical protein
VNYFEWTAIPQSSTELPPNACESPEILAFVETIIDMPKPRAATRGFHEKAVRVND